MKSSSVSSRGRLLICHAFPLRAGCQRSRVHNCTSTYKSSTLNISTGAGPTDDHQIGPHPSQWNFAICCAILVLPSAQPNRRHFVFASLVSPSAPPICRHLLRTCSPSSLLVDLAVDTAEFVVHLDWFMGSSCLGAPWFDVAFDMSAHTFCSI